MNRWLMTIALVFALALGALAAQTQDESALSYESFMMDAAILVQEDMDEEQDEEERTSEWERSRL